MPAASPRSRRLRIGLAERPERPERVIRASMPPKKRAGGGGTERKAALLTVLAEKRARPAGFSLGFGKLAHEKPATAVSPVLWAHWRIAPGAWSRLHSAFNSEGFPCPVEGSLPNHHAPPCAPPLPCPPAAVLQRQESSPLRSPDFCSRAFSLPGQGRRRGCRSSWRTMRMSFRMTMA